MLSKNSTYVVVPGTIAAQEIPVASIKHVLTPSSVLPINSAWIFVMLAITVSRKKSKLRIYMVCSEKLARMVSYRQSKMRLWTSIHVEDLGSITALEIPVASITNALIPNLALRRNSASS